MRSTVHCPQYLLLSLVCAVALSADTYYVSPAGDDVNPGTQARPFAALARAERAARPGDTVVLEDGLYSLGWGGMKVTHGGQPGRPITWRAAHAGKAVLRNSAPLVGFVRYKGHLWRARLDRRPSAAYEDGDALYHRWEYKFNGPDDPRIQRGHWQWFDGAFYVWPWEDDDPNAHEMRVAFDSIVTLDGGVSHRVFEGLVFEHGYDCLKWASAECGHILVRNCLFRDSNMGIGGGGRSTIEHCTFCNIGASKFEHGIYDGQEGTVIRYCHFDRISGGALHLYKHPKDITVCYNTIGPPKRRRVVDRAFAGMHVGIYAWGRGGHKVYRNVIYGGHRVGISLAAPNSTVTRNTLAGIRRWGVLILKPAVGSRVVRNVVAAKSGMFVAAAPSQIVLDYNLYAGSGQWSWGGAGHKGGRAVATLDAFQHMSGQDGHSIRIDKATFLDPLASDYRLAPWPAAIAFAAGAFDDAEPWPERPGVTFGRSLAPPG